MRSNARGSAARWIAMSLTLVLVGCGSAKVLDQRADQVIAAFQKGDYGLLRQVASPGLLKEIPRARFEGWAEIFRELGAVRARTRAGIEIKAGGSARGVYELDVPRGRVRLELVLRGGWVEGLSVDGEGWTAAARVHRRKQLATFKLGGLRFEDEQGKAHGDHYGAGQKVFVALEIWGLTLVEGQGRVRLGLHVRDGAGATVLENPALLDHTARLTEDRRALTVTTRFLPRGAGRYRLAFHVEDVHGKRAFDHEREVIVD